MILSAVWDWLKQWDARRTIYALLLTDTIIAETQALWFFANLLWEMRDAFMIQAIETIQYSGGSGDMQYPSYQTIRIYFIVIGALITRFFTNWVLFDGLVTGLTSHIQAGIMGTGCTTLYITVGGFIFCIHTYLYLSFSWWFMALMLLGFTAYAALSICVLTFVWRERASGRIQMQSLHVTASIILVFGVFVGFVHFQILFWALTFIFNVGGRHEEKTFALMNEGQHCSHGD